MNDKIRQYLETYQLKDNKTPILARKKRLSATNREKYGITTQYANYYHNLYNGKEGFTFEEIQDENAKKNGFTQIPISRYLIIRHVVEYLPEFDAIAILSFSIKTGDYKDWPVKKWNYIGGCIIKKDKTCSYYCKHAFWNKGILEEEWIYVPDVKFNNIPYNLRLAEVKTKDSIIGINGETYQEITKTMLKIFPQSCNIGANTHVDITLSAKELLKFLMFKEPIGKNGPAQKKIDELVKKPLPSLPSIKKTEQKLGILQKVENGLCVLRTFYLQEDKYVESARIYFGKRKAYACKISNDNRFLQMTLKTTAKNWKFYLLSFDKTITKGTMLEYYSEIIETIPANMRILYMWCFATYPIFEQLYKGGFQQTVDFILNNSEERSPLYLFKKIFGEPCKGKTLAAQLGLNKYQMKIAEEYINSFVGHSYYDYYSDFYRNALFQIRLIFDDEYENINDYDYDYKPQSSLSDIDNETFDILFKLMKNIDGFGAYHERKCITESLNKIRLHYSLQAMKHASECLENTKKERVSIGYYRVPAHQLFTDYIEMVLLLDATKYFKPYFSDIKELQEKHDYLVEVVNAKKTEILMDSFDNRKKFWDTLSFSDENSPFVVIRPDSPEDLAKEGMELHHCVKSYIERVAQGKTNIMFIRKKDEIEKPFFTVEITNDKTIQQVHGSFNRNVNTEPGMADFVCLWSKKCGLKQFTINKVR